MRLLLLAACSLLLVAASAVAAPAGTTRLRVAFFEDGGLPGTKVVWTLRCEPAGGTLPRPVVACRELRRLGWQTLRPVPADVACTEIYGGPQVAIVTGLVDGRRVWAKLRRDNGCEIDRWTRNRFLVPAGGVR
jgi:hypothetical protein